MLIGFLETDGTQLQIDHPMRLSKENTARIPQNQALEKPGEHIFHLPERILQFGTGVLLRGLPDYFIDKANKNGIFNGRVVAIKSTSTGGVNAFDEQDGLYTVCIRGIEGESTVEENIINASISRVLSAKTQWNEILACASNPEMQIVISNTTEIGITLVNDDVHALPPESFPGKLLALLYKRYQVYQGDKSKGMVILPTELIIDNGIKLKNIIIELAYLNQLEGGFIDWITNDNYFCNSLVDRIVPGKLPDHEQKKLETRFGYHDSLMIMSEVYRLWAIESNESRVIDLLSFANADPGVVVTGNIEIFRELKLRLLNGPHSFCCAIAYLSGFTTVKEAMDNQFFASFITNLITKEIAPAIVNKEILEETARDFGMKVIDRFRNPHIHHQWLSISAQYSSKIKLRCIPLIKNYYRKHQAIPQCMTLGFAAFLYFMKAEQDANGKFVGNADGKAYPIQDDQISLFAETWRHFDTVQFVKEILADRNLWEDDLSEIPGFTEAVTINIQSLEMYGALPVLKSTTSPNLVEQHASLK
jgi:tagaturonate reductase